MRATKRALNKNTEKQIKSFKFNQMSNTFIGVQEWKQTTFNLTNNEIQIVELTGGVNECKKEKLQNDCSHAQYLFQFRFISFFV